MFKSLKGATTYTLLAMKFMTYLTFPINKHTLWTERPVIVYCGYCGNFKEPGALKQGEGENLKIMEMQNIWSYLP